MEGFEREGDAPFNMAVATLMRLDTILQQIRTIDFLFPSNSIDKQKAHIGLVKQFFVNAIPLLSDVEVNDVKGEILSLDISYANNIKSGVQVRKPYYNKELEITLNELLIKLQQKLKKYFMPTGKDPRSAVANFN